MGEFNMTLPGSLPVGPVRSLEDLNRRARALPTRIVVIAAAQDEGQGVEARPGAGGVEARRAGEAGRIDLGTEPGAE